MGIHDLVSASYVYRVLINECRQFGRYGRLNGVHTSENKWLLNDLLRKEWGFDGAVISDW